MSIPSAGISLVINSQGEDALPWQYKSVQEHLSHLVQSSLKVATVLYSYFNVDGSQLN